jgi:hypothetical protein
MCRWKEMSELSQRRWHLQSFSEEFRESAKSLDIDREEGIAKARW